MIGALLSRLLPGRVPGARPRTIVVGLGNPGPRYTKHRHNVGARTLEHLAGTLSIRIEKRGRWATTGEVRTPHGAVVLARPRAFMNESGKAVQSLMTQYRAKPTDLIVIVDDLDLPPGRIRIRPQGSDAGHNGLRSIKQIVGTLTFPRVRIGIGRPLVDGAPSWDSEAVASYVLSAPRGAEAEALAAAERRAAAAVVAILRDGVEPAMNAFNSDTAGANDAPPQR